MGEIWRFLWGKLSSGDPISIAVAAMLIILTGSSVVAFAHGMDGRCRVNKFDINDAADYGCSTGLFLRGFFENIPTFDSVKNQP